MEDLSGDTTKSENKQLNKSKRKASKPCKHGRKNQLQYNLPTPAQQETRRGGQTDPQITSWWERPTKERPNKNQKPKTYTETTETTAQDQ